MIFHKYLNSNYQILGRRHWNLALMKIHGKHRVVVGAGFAAFEAAAAAVVDVVGVPFC